MKIYKFNSKIKKIKDVSKSAREMSFSIPTEIRKDFSFLPGQFMNLFLEINEEKERRAYSISSSIEKKNDISFCIRNNKKGKFSKIFWDESFLKREFKLMGPVGLNTVDKLKNKNIFLLAMGVGISPVKSIVDFLIKNTDKKIKLFYGNLNEEEILYKNYFDKISEKNKNFSVEYILSKPENKNYNKIGYVQDFLDTENFENSSVYICGISKMTESCKIKIESKNPRKINIIEESFN